MTEATCYYCPRPAEAECPSCGRLYCGLHGDDACMRCLSPGSAVPGPLLFRGSVLTLVVATLVTIFLVVRPPEDKSQGPLVRELPTTTPLASATATPTPPGRTATPPRTASGTPSPASATASPPATASASATAAGPRTYVVQPGDSLSAIAAEHDTTVDALLEANPGLTEDITAGDEINLP